MLVNSMQKRKKEAAIMRPPSAICHTFMSRYSISIRNLYLLFGSKKIIIIMKTTLESQNLMI